MGGSVADRVPEVGGLVVAAQREVDDVGAVVHRPLHCLGDLGRIVVPVLLVEDAHGQDLGSGGYARQSGLAVSGDDPGHGCAVADGVGVAEGVVGGRSAVAAEGERAQSGVRVDEAAAGEHRVPEVGVVRVDTGVDHRDGHPRAVGGLPGRFGVDGHQVPAELVGGRHRGGRQERQQRRSGADGGEASKAVPHEIRMFTQRYRSSTALTRESLYGFVIFALLTET